MEGVTGTTPSVTDERLRWVDLVPVLVFTVLGIILIFMALLGLSRSAPGFYRANLQAITLLATLGVYLAVGAGLAVGLRRLASPLRFLGLRWPTARDLGLTLLLFLPWYFGIILVAALSAVLLNGGWGVPSNSRLVFIQPPHGLGILVLALLVTAVVAPICEEIFFRGMLFWLLRR